MNARVTARYNIQYAADDVLGIFELVSTDPETLSALQALYAGQLLRRFTTFLTTNLGKTPKHYNILKLYGEANAVFSWVTAELNEFYAQTISRNLRHTTPLYFGYRLRYRLLLITFNSSRYSAVAGRNG
jgi:hypothetical protein